MGARRGLLIVAVVGALLPFPTQADQLRVRDPNDTTGPLDIASVSHGHRTNERGVRQLVHTVRLYERWPVRRLRHRGHINLFFDLPGDPEWREERAVYVSYQDGRLRAQMINFGADPPQPMGFVSLRRPDPRTIKVAFRKSLLRSQLSTYRWNAVSFIEQRHNLCGESGGCGDLAPNRGYVRHEL